MVAVPCVSTAPIPPPACHRPHAKQAEVCPALHLDALTLVTRLHLLALCRLAVRLSHCRRPPPVPAGPAGHPRVYDEALLLAGRLLVTGRAHASASTTRLRRSKELIAAGS
jgi:hypothetical protein